MVRALTECLLLLTDDQQTVTTLYFHVYNKLGSIKTEEYDVYCLRRAVEHGPNLHLNRWRAAVAELHEAMQLAEMFGEDPNEKTANCLCYTAPVLPRRSTTA